MLRVARVSDKPQSIISVHGMTYTYEPDPVFLTIQEYFSSDQVSLVLLASP